MFYAEHLGDIHRAAVSKATLVEVVARLETQRRATSEDHYDRAKIAL
jgi:hypothetical protein